MSEPLIARREALRALDRRLTAVTVDVDQIVDEANQVHLYAGPIGVTFDVGTSAPEGQVLEELAEIAHELGRLVDDAVVPEVPDAAGWSVTADRRIVELHALVDELQVQVRQAFAATVAALPADVVSEPLADPVTALDDEIAAPGDHRARNRAILSGSFTALVIGFMLWGGFVDLDAVAAACSTTPPCEGDDPSVTLYPNGWIVVERKDASCEPGVRVLFDHDGAFVERLAPGEAPSPDRWPSTSPRGRGLCSDQESLRWTWVMGWKHQR